MRTKNCTLILITMLLSVSLFAQPVIKGQKTIGGNSFDHLSSLCLTKDGGVLVGGTSESGVSGEKTSANRGEYYGDFWLVKLDSNGHIEWDKTIGGDSQDQLSHATQTQDEGFIICGMSASGISGEKTEDPRGSQDFWVLKLDNLGNIQWQRTLSGTGDDWPSCVRQLPDGGYLVGGNSSSGISGDKTGANRGGYDYWLVKLDATGNIIWDKTYGGTKFESTISFGLTKDAG
jgi:hypothetical protein